VQRCAPATFVTVLCHSCCQTAAGSDTPLLVSAARLISPAFLHSNFRIPTAKLEQCSVQCCPDIRKSSALSECSHPSPACPSDKSSINMKISMEHWYCDTDRGQPQDWERNLYRCHFICHKSHMDWSEIEAGPSR